jgi:hypothetical protein
MDTPHTMKYEIVVSRESVCIGLALAALDDLDVKMADIEDPYLTAPITEKVWTVLVPEFGVHDGKKGLIVRSLYDLKYVVTVFRNHLAECMAHLGWTSCRARRSVDEAVKTARR